MSKCLWSGREWLWGAKEMPPLPCIPVIRKCSWKENPDKKKKPLSIFFSFGIRFFTLQLHVVRDLADVFVTSLLYTLVISLSCMHFLFCFVVFFIYISNLFWISPFKTYSGFRELNIVSFDEFCDSLSFMDFAS